MQRVLENGSASTSDQLQVQSSHFTYWWRSDHQKSGPLCFRLNANRVAHTRKRSQMKRCMCYLCIWAEGQSEAAAQVT